MRPKPLCRDVASELSGLVDGDLEPVQSVALETHVRACGACAALVRRERSLRALLVALPDAPPVELHPPRLPDEAGGRLFRLRSAWSAGAAAAAALLAAWVLLPDRPGTGAPGGADVSAANGAERTVSELRVVDTDDVAPAWDDGLLGLVAGAEAVASRRLAEDR